MQIRPGSVPERWQGQGNGQDRRPGKRWGVRVMLLPNPPLTPTLPLPSPLPGKRELGLRLEQGQEPPRDDLWGLRILLRLVALSLSMALPR